jgi:lysyl endopeptidase
MFCRLITTTAAVVATILAVVLPSPSAEAATDIRSVPPAEYRGKAAVKTALKLVSGAPAHRIELEAPGAAEAAPMKSYNAAGATGSDGKGHPLAIGFGRELPMTARTIPLSKLTWIAAPDGGRTARIEIASAGAAALRVALMMSAAHPDLTVRFAGSAANATVFGDYPVNAIAEESMRSGLFWSPVLAGETATIEFHAAADVSVSDVTLRIPRVSHQVVTGAGLLWPSPIVTKLTGIGAAGACEIDIACVTPASQPMLDLAKAVAKLQFVGDDGRSYLCSGALLNDSTQSFTPYLHSANHCLESASIARTLNTFWFYDAGTCNDKERPPYVQLTGGAMLLGRSPDRDWSIVRLLDAPPAGVQFAAWRAEAIPVGADVAAIHHPKGDLKKWSVGISTDDVFIDDVFVYGNFTEIVWNSGVTEEGSSGSPLLTLAAGGAYYEIRGGLYGGASSCEALKAPDYYSELQSALPVMRQYLTPDAANPLGLVVATEFYNRTLDHYFLSTNPVEINNLDTGATVGWERTGLRFLVYDNPAPGTSPVCRFYRAPAYGDSHFYSASPAECAATAAAHPVDWIYESPNVFYVQLPNTATGACPAGTRPVYRFFRAATTNHRYTMEIVVRNELGAAPGWTAEGYGPGPYYPIMCAVAQ